MMPMLQELSDFKGMTTAQVFGAVVVSLACLAFFAEVFADGVSTSIRALRGPRQVISHNICPKCQKIKTQEIDPSNP